MYQIAWLVACFGLFDWLIFTPHYNIYQLQSCSPHWFIWLVSDYLIGWFSPLIIHAYSLQNHWSVPLIDLSDWFQTIWLVDFHPSLYMRIACRIIGLYASLVYLIGRLFRTMLFSGQMYRVMFEELPYVDRILALCKDIYLVRECQNWRLEEDLFAKLIFLFRSPDMLFRWTKMKYD